jgi:hypothetical protein
MNQPGVTAWIIGTTSAITFLPLMGAQLSMLFRPNHRQSKDLITGKGQEWRDETHFKPALAFARAGWPVILTSGDPSFTGDSSNYFLTDSINLSVRN